MIAKEISVFHKFLKLRGALDLFKGAISSYGFEKKNINEYEKSVSALMAIRYAFPWNKVNAILNWDSINDKWEDVCIKHGFHELKDYDYYDIKLNIDGLFQGEQNLLKQCSKCQRYLPESSFYIRRDNRKIQSQCIDCCKAHGRLKNGTTGVYKKEGDNLKNSNMEDFTFYDFTSSDGKRRLQENQFSINHKKSNHSVTVCQQLSTTILNTKLLYLRIRKDNITGDIHFVFNREVGCKITTNGSSENKNVTIINKPLVEFLVKELSLSESSERDVLELSKNLSNSPDYLTYKILRKEYKG